MSKTCEFEKLLPDFLDGSLNSNDYNIFTTHLDNCKDCSDLVEDLNSVQSMLSDYKRSEPSVELLYSYQTRLAKQFPVMDRLQVWRAAFKFQWQHIWDFHAGFMKISRAFAFVFIGILIGRFIFYAPSIETLPETEPQVFIISPDTQDVRLVSEFFTQSEMLLLAIKHTDENTAQKTTDLQFEKQLAQNLLFKSQQLQGNMIVLQDQELKDFLDKLEQVLLEISNTDDQKISYIFTELKKIITLTNLDDQSKKIQKKIEKMI